LAQAGQYHGAGVFTGLGLRLRQTVQRKRFPLTAVLGRFCLPVLRILAIAHTLDGANQTILRGGGRLSRGIIRYNAGKDEPIAGAGVANIP